MDPVGYQVVVLPHPSLLEIVFFIALIVTVSVVLLYRKSKH